jgi:hypothetical protein
MASRDFTIEEHGSLFLLIPHTTSARELVAERIVDDPLTWKYGVVVGQNYVIDLVAALREEGFRINT